MSIDIFLEMYRRMMEVLELASETIINTARRSWKFKRPYTAWPKSRRKRFRAPFTMTARGSGLVDSVEIKGRPS